MDAKVRDVMTPGPIGVDYRSSIGDAARAMHEWGVGAVLVTEDGFLRGLVTARDLVVRGTAAGKSTGEPVGPLASTALIGVAAEASIGEAAQLMRQHDIRRLPVRDGGEITGVISMSDLALHWELSAEVEELGSVVSLPAA